MNLHEYNNVDNGFSISTADNLSIGYDLTNLQLERRRLNGTSSSSVIRLWRTFAQDELSLGGYPVDLILLAAKCVVHVLQYGKTRGKTEEQNTHQKRPAQWL